MAVRVVNARGGSRKAKPEAESRPKVLIMGLNFAPEVTGIAPYTTTLARGLVERGFDIQVLTAHPHYPQWRIHDGYGAWSSHETTEGMVVRRLRHYVPANPRGVRRVLSEVSFGLRLLFVRWDAPDVIVLVSPALFSSAIALFRARFGRRRPAVNIWVQDLYSLGISETKEGGGVVTRLITGVEKRTLSSASGVVVIHSRFASYVSETLGIDPARVCIVRNWTHLREPVMAETANVRLNHGWRKGETIILHAGNMGVKQGLKNVVAAARLAEKQQLPLKFVLLGNGSEQQMLKHLGDGAANLQFIEALSDEAYQHALGAADILLVNELPGVSEMAVPSKLTSYFNAKRPVIAATDLHGVTASEIRAADGGVIVAAGEPQLLVDAALKLRNDPATASELGASGYHYREHVLGQEQALDRYAQWVRGLAKWGDRKRGRPLPVFTQGNHD